jgi:replicative DNA helicase|uniref:Replicative DNA helicase n=1 Tax=candidate division WOR-3 bacterium TaxID=2052148 RepID=A0A7C3YP89_UNCW3
MEERKIPYDLDAEAAVLGAILLDPQTLPRVLEYLDESCFYLELHRQIFRTIVSLFERNICPDYITVSDELEKQKVLAEGKGKETLLPLVDSVATTANVEDWAKLVLEKALLRRLIQTANQIVRESMEEVESVDNLLDRSEQLIFSIREAKLKKSFIPLKELLMETMKEVEELSQKERKRFITGLETGFYKLDELTSGLQLGDFIIIAGRPSMGKTAFGLNIATQVAQRNNCACAIFSLEMSKELLAQRVLCSEMKISLKNLRLGRISRDEMRRMAQMIGPLYRSEIYIDDTPSLSVLDIRAKARRLKAETNLSLIVIDYLQLLEGVRDVKLPFRSRQELVAEMSKSLKALAKELNIAVVCISQLSRSPEKRDPPIPQLSDLRESGAIEQDADLVIFLYREEMYKRDSKNKGKAEVIIAKQRNGPTGHFYLAFLGEYMRFENLTLTEEEEIIEEI